MLLLIISRKLIYGDLRVNLFTWACVGTSGVTALVVKCGVTASNARSGITALADYSGVNA